ncbi:MAG: hypothetical protein GX666_01205 [Tissierellia bacterium]|jgi:hypothetical protein|nr:hypothetical protein [Tissierellia bacterium]
MDFFEAIILFMIVRGALNFFGASKKKSSSKERKSRQTQFQPRTPNKSNSRNPYETKKKQQKGRDLTSILSNLQMQFEELEAQSKGETTRKNTSYAETVINQDKSKRKEVQVLEPQVLRSESRKRVDELYEGMGGLAEEKISIEEMKDYQESLYGDLDEDSLFDYDISMDMDAEWESDEASKIIDILDDREALMDLKTAIIFSEVLGKPISIRK